jgi:hypothetical protein
MCPEKFELFVGLREGCAYKEGDIKFLEFCGVAWRESRDGGLLQLLERERVVIPLESLVRAPGEEVGLEEILKTHRCSTLSSFLITTDVFTRDVPHWRCI